MLLLLFFREFLSVHCLKFLFIFASIYLNDWFVLMYHQVYWRNWLPQNITPLTTRTIRAITHTLLKVKWRPKNMARTKPITQIAFGAIRYVVSLLYIYIVSATLRTTRLDLRGLTNFRARSVLMMMSLHIWCAARTFWGGATTCLDSRRSHKLRAALAVLLYATYMTWPYTRINILEWLSVTVGKIATHLTRGQ